MLFQRAPVAVTWSDLAKPCPWSKAIGNGIYCAPWHSASSYPIPQKGNGILFLCGFIFAIIIIIPFPQKGNGILFLCGFIFAIIIIIIFDVVVVVVVKIPSFFKISQWNLVGT